MKLRIWSAVKNFASFVLLPQTRLLGTSLRSQVPVVSNRLQGCAMESTAIPYTCAVGEGTTSKDKESNEAKSDHLTRTSNNTRDEGIHSVKVQGLAMLSPTVKEIVLRCETIPPPFEFKAGQWVDVFMPGVDKVGGFSMCSSPQELNTCGLMRLAVKYSDHPPAQWMHKNCRVGDVLKVRVGGDFYLSCDKHTIPYNILLVAGGVGINPLCSIVRYVYDGKKEGLIHPHSKIYLLYSSKTEDELIFRKSLDSDYAANGTVVRKYFVTGTPHRTPKSEDSILYRRIDSSDLKTAINALQASEGQRSSENTIQAYVCGPPPMISSVTEALKIMNITKINFEQWW